MYKKLFASIFAGISITILIIVTTQIYFQAGMSEPTRNTTIHPSQIVSSTTLPTTTQAAATIRYNFTPENPSDYTVIQTFLTERNNIRPDKKENETDIYLENKTTNEELLYTTLQDVYFQHAHAVEYYNGNLYVIHRLNYDGYPDDDWIDELWRYDTSGNGYKLFSSKGLNFTPIENEKYIVIDTNDEISIIDVSGKIIKQFPVEELYVNEDVPIISVYAYLNNQLWLDNTFGPSLMGFTKIDLTSYDISKIDLTELPIGPEYALNMSTGKIAGSNYPALLDSISAEDFYSSNEVITLIVYDPNTKEQEIIDTSITKRFNPHWIDENTLQYSNPESSDPGDKITVQID